MSSFLSLLWLRFFSIFFLFSITLVFFLPSFPFSTLMFPINKEKRIPKIILMISFSLIPPFFLHSLLFSFIILFLCLMTFYFLLCVSTRAHTTHEARGITRNSNARVHHVFLYRAKDAAHRLLLWGDTDADVEMKFGLICLSRCLPFIKPSYISTL